MGITFAGHKFYPFEQSEWDHLDEEIGLQHRVTPACYLLSESVDAKGEHIGAYLFAYLLDV
jgi:hypothetical protein